MNPVYAISGADSDFKSAHVDEAGRLTIPEYQCPTCGEIVWDAPVWHASLSPKDEPTAELLKRTYPKQISYPEYLQLRADLQAAFKCQSGFHPGSICGALPLRIQTGKEKTISGLTWNKLRKQLDWIQAGLFHWIVSQRVADRLKFVHSSLKLTPIQFDTEESVPTQYHLIELEPVLVWSAAERAKWELRICETCGGKKRRSGGTFRPKEFDPARFEPGPVICRGFEANGTYINQAMHDVLAGLENNGCSFDVAGSW